MANSRDLYTITVTLSNPYVVVSSSVVAHTGVPPELVNTEGAYTKPVVNAMPLRWNHLQRTT
jgi:hypothetical protein